MKLPVRPALPNATKDNDAHLTRPSSTYKSGNVVQTTGATSESTGSARKKVHRKLAHIVSSYRTGDAQRIGRDRECRIDPSAGRKK